MDSLLNVEKEIDRVLSKFSNAGEQTDTRLEDLARELSEISEKLKEEAPDQELSPAQALALEQCIKKVKGTVNTISNDHRELHSSVSKIGKAIDRNFLTDISTVCQDGAFEGAEKANLINEVICQHFFKKGNVDIAEELIKEASLNISDETKEPFIEINSILETLRRKELAPALEWAALHREELEAQHSSLEFRLHWLHFTQLLRGGAQNQPQILAYAKTFDAFAAQHARELQVLMGSLLYLRKGVDQSPYAHLLDPLHWVEICELFSKDACTLLGLSIEGALSVSVKAGCSALPSLINIRKVMKDTRMGGMLYNKEELPIEVDLGNDCRFHSVFACPILKQQCSDSNPPMRLICGHVISKESLSKLITGNKLKCPYCPMEQSPGDAKLLHLY